jgi:multidrug resistance efflux pump
MNPADTPDQPTTRPAENNDLPAPLGRALLMAALALLAGWGSMVWLDNQGTTVFTGIVHAPLQSVTSPVDGRVVEFTAEAHDLVHKGGPIAILEDRHFVGRVNEQRSEVARLQDELAQAEARAEVDLAWRLKDLQAEIHQTKLKAADLLRQRLMRDVENLAWGELRNGSEWPVLLASAEEIFSTINDPRLPSDELRIRAALREEAARNASEVLTAQIELCDQRLSELRELSLQLPNKVRQAAGISRALTKLAAVQQQLGHLESQPALVTAAAAAYGVVGVFRKQIGSPVAQGETIVDLLDLDNPFLVVHVRSRELDQFSVGKEVSVEFPGRIKRTGVVHSIPPQTEDGRSTATAVEGETHVRVRIDRTGKLWPEVPVGSTVDVKVAH